jgi:hypothetical protein
VTAGSELKTISFHALILEIRSVCTQSLDLHGETLVKTASDKKQQGAAIWKHMSRVSVA